jgi:hypothetical protein
MKVWTLWYGGASYAAPGVDDIEEFSSLADAKEIFRLRCDCGAWLGTPLYTPCVDAETTRMHVFHHDPREEAPVDLYPDRVLAMGPRGGIRVETA